MTRVAENLPLADGLSMDIHSLSRQAAEGMIDFDFYVSRGLARHGQKEIGIGVRIRPGEVRSHRAPQVRDLFIPVFELARTGRVVDVGGRTILTPASPPIFGRPDFRAIMYACMGT